MKISLTDAGKRFNRDWIFRHLNYEFQAGHSYAIVGPNGSGKSTLLQVLSGSMMLSEGNAGWNSASDGNAIDSEYVYSQVAICAPYLEVVEEMSLSEFFSFHQHFKPLMRSVTIKEIAERLGLSSAMAKQIRYYSSGMKQRIKLAQAIFSDVPAILLDEPCTNLDSEGISLYHQLIKEYCRDRLIIISSNDEVEYSFCDKKINMRDYKS